MLEKWLINLPIKDLILAFNTITFSNGNCSKFRVRGFAEGIPTGEVRSSVFWVLSSVFRVKRGVMLRRLRSFRLEVCALEMMCYKGLPAYFEGLSMTRPQDSEFKVLGLRLLSDTADC